jgi:malonate transporter and related proteins
MAVQRSSRKPGRHRYETRVSFAGILPRVNYPQLLFPDFSLILCGYLLCRFTALKRNIWEPVESLVYYFLFPVLLFHSIIKSPLDFNAASGLIAAGLCMGLSGIALSYSLPWLPWIGRHIDARLHAGSAQVAFRFNSFVGLALATRLAGPEGGLYIAILIGFCVPMYNIGAVWPMARHAKRNVSRELLRNPLIIATSSGLLANVLGFTLPTWAEPGVKNIAAAALPLGLMAAGAGLQLGSLFKARWLTICVLAIRHFLTPLIALGLSYAFGLSPVQATILMAFSALPTASSAYVLATRMGYDGAYVASLVTVSTLLGMVSLPFALSLR